MPLVTNAGTDPLLVSSEAAPRHTLRFTHDTHSHVHTWHRDTHSHVHHLVWSMRSRAWQFVINIIPRPLPLDCVHMDQHKQTGWVVVVHAPPLNDTLLPPCFSSVASGAGWWVVGLFELQLLTVPSQQGHLCTSHPLILTSILLTLCLHFFCPDCHLLSAWLTGSKTMTKSVF